MFLTYDREEGTAVLKGVEQAYTEDPELQSCIVDGEFTLMHGEVAQAVTGRGLAVEMGHKTAFPGSDRSVLSGQGQGDIPCQSRRIAQQGDVLSHRDVFLGRRELCQYAFSCR